METDIENIIQAYVPSFSVLWTNLLKTTLFIYKFDKINTKCFDLTYLYKQLLFSLLCVSIVCIYTCKDKLQLQFIQTEVL